MHKPPRFITKHRLARLVAWAQAMLTWLARALLADVAPSRRHIRQRYPAFSLDWAERIVRALAVTRAVELAGLRKRPRPPLRNAAGRGFRRRVARGAVLRAVAGSRFRKALKHRDAAQRLQRLIAAFADIDAFARRHLVARARRRLTRLHAVIPSAPPSAPCLAQAAPEPRAVNTS
jgi:hypothetical protein